jgi:hypothetical protein
MAQKLKAAMAPDLDLNGNWRIEWDAVDPTTGASVAGVKVSNTSLQVAGDLGGGGLGDQVGPFMLVPGPSG